MSEPQGFFISSSFSLAWRVFKIHWAKLIGYYLLSIALSIVLSMLSSGLDRSLSWLKVLIVVMSYCLQNIMVIGLIRVILGITRGEEVTIQTLFSGGNRLFAYLGGMFLYGFTIAAGLILFIVPGLIWSIKFMWTPYLIADEGLGPIEAMKKSARMTNGVKWDLVGFMMACVVLMYAGILALLVGALITIPVAMLSYAGVYLLSLEREKHLDRFRTEELMRTPPMNVSKQA